MSRFIGARRALYRAPAVVEEAGGAWTPADLGANLMAWYKGDAGTFESDGTTPVTADNAVVEQWNDQSGNGLHLTGGAVDPTLQTAMLNGMSCVSFGGLEPALSPETLALSGTRQHLSVFTVRRCPAQANGNARVIALSTTGGGDTSADTCIPQCFLGGPQDTTLSCYQSGQKANTTVTVNTWYRVGTVWNGTSNIMYIDGSAVSTVANTPTFASALAVGIGVGSSAVVDYAEIVIADIAISGGTLTDIDDYFTTRWGL